MKLSVHALVRRRSKTIIGLIALIGVMFPGCRSTPSPDKSIINTWGLGPAFHVTLPKGLTEAVVVRVEFGGKRQTTRKIQISDAEAARVHALVAALLSVPHLPPDPRIAEGLNFSVVLEEDGAIQTRTFKRITRAPEALVELLTILNRHSPPAEPIH